MTTYPVPVGILAGGLATRLGTLAEHTPKALMEVAGRPFIAHQLDQLAGQGVRRVVLCVGHQAERIESAVGPRWAGMEIAYSHDGDQPAGTLGALRRAATALGPRFLILYGDTYLRVDYRAFFTVWSESGRPAAMTVLRNEGRWGPSNAVYQEGLVACYDKDRPDPAMQWIDYGLGGLTAAVLDAAGAAQADLAPLYRELAATGRLAGFEVADRFYEIGSPAALAETDAFLRRSGDRD